MSAIRADITDNVKNGGVALELGTSEGKFTEQLILKNKFLHVYTVDSWDNLYCPIYKDIIHDEQEYKKALTRLDIYKSFCSIFGTSFDSALSIFPDQYFDFIYIDGDPTTGENFGKTLQDWLPKIKKDGVMAGSNCSKEYQNLLEYLSVFAKNNNFNLRMHDFTDKDDVYSKHPSWYIQLNESTFEFPHVNN